MLWYLLQRPSHTIATHPHLSKLLQYLTTRPLHQNWHSKLRHNFINSHSSTKTWTTGCFIILRNVIITRNKFHYTLFVLMQAFTQFFSYWNFTFITGMTLCSRPSQYINRCWYLSTHYTLLLWNHQFNGWIVECHQITQAGRDIATTPASKRSKVSIRQQAAKFKAIVTVMYHTLKSTNTVLMFALLCYLTNLSTDRTVK